MKRVLFVCTGNICRSPMAVGLLNQRLAQDGLVDSVQVTSAGVWGLDGKPASQPGVEVLSQRDIDISQHRARTVEEEDLAAADLVLVMEEAHRRSLFHRYPHLLGKIFLLSEMAGEHGDVQDPYRRPWEAYLRCADELARLIGNGYVQILARLGVALDG